MEHIVNAVFCEQTSAKFLKRREEHPALHVDHAILAVGQQAVDSQEHEDREEVCLAFFIVVLHILGKHTVKSA